MTPTTPTNADGSPRVVLDAVVMRFPYRHLAEKAAKKHGGTVRELRKRGRISSFFSVQLADGTWLQDNRPKVNYDMTNDKILDRAAAVQKVQDTHARSFA